MLNLFSSGIIFSMQLEIFPFESLTSLELETIFGFISNRYWYLRNLRGGRFGQARRRKQYRLIAVQKNRLLMSGMSKREVLDFLACCRLRCSWHSHPFVPCRYCVNVRVAPPLV